MENQSITEIQHLADVGRLLNLAGEGLHTFIRTEQALARDERIRVREERKEDDKMMAAKAEKLRLHKLEDEERIRQHD